MPEFIEFEADFEAAVADVVAAYVRTELPLGIYNPLQPRRPRVEVADFTVELLDFEEDAGGLFVNAGGPVVLRAPDGDLERYLRVSLRLTRDGGAVRIADPAVARAIYVEETGHPNGGCKETAALANA